MMFRQKVINTSSRQMLFSLELKNELAHGGTAAMNVTLCGVKLRGVLPRPTRPVLGPPEAVFSRCLAVVVPLIIRVMANKSFR